jgi:predicted TIM-barrel fold metal-dependent hydrolase
MGIHSLTKSQKVHEQLDYPVIDTDGHMLEFTPVFFDYLKEVGGPDIVARTQAGFRQDLGRGWRDFTLEERRDRGIMRLPFWGAPTKNKIDRATAVLPRLMRERLPSFGIDYSIVYPTIGFLLPDFSDDEVRQAACRAQNVMLADLFRDCADRLTPAATIPCHTPEEAIAELDFAVDTLGFKVAMLGNLVRRPIKAFAHLDPDLAGSAYWIDTLALDSLYDYDPLWQKCIDLKVAVTAHSGTQGIDVRRSCTNYMFNQTGHFAEAGHAFARALFFGGVTHRFPTLNFAFLECGVAWGATLLCDLKERWNKRNREAVQQFNPAYLDAEHLDRMFKKYGGDVFRGKMLSASGTSASRFAVSPSGRSTEDSEDFDDFAATGMTKLEDLYDRFVSNFYFGCEADDPTTINAFNCEMLPFGAKLKAMISSDIGHWDVPDMTMVLEEAYELVERGLMSEQDFRDFAFTNPVSLHAGMNPDFFKGTVVENAVDGLLQASPEIVNARSSAEADVL